MARSKTSFQGEIFIAISNKEEALQSHLDRHKVMSYVWFT
jgi:hypothetical protein